MNDYYYVYMSTLSDEDIKVRIEVLCIKGKFLKYKYKGKEHLLECFNAINDLIVGDMIYLIIDESIPDKGYGIDAGFIKD